jgi:glutaminyl-tRNA synthetase
MGSRARRARSLNLCGPAVIPAGASALRRRERDTKMAAVETPRQLEPSRGSERAMSEALAPPASNFIQDVIDADKASGKHGGQVVTRFPPEPNGYLHIGHAKSICLNFGLARDNGGRCHLRFDDTNPAKEELEYVESIKEDVRWLGFDWGEHEYYASDYFEPLYLWAKQLIAEGKAYVDELSADEIREYRGTLKEPGRPSPYRERPVEESLALFEKMKNGEIDEGKAVLRAKIDMASPILNLRDPTLYRVKKAHHHRTGDAWSIYPMYDWAHGQSDAIEGVTHSICTLEFINHRPLYEWFLDQLAGEPLLKTRPHQYEFARLNLSYTVMSKRKLLELVTEQRVSGWDDPRMLTLSGLRRRGFTPASIRHFAKLIGVSRNDSWIDLGILEHCIREDLNESAERRMGVLRPLKVVITNYPEDKTEHLETANHPQRPELGSRTVPFTRELYIEQEDFMEDPPKKFFRLGPGREVRLRSAYFIKCEEVLKDDEGNVVELRCTYDPKTRGGAAPDGRKVKGTLHWVSATHGHRATVRLYDRLFSEENPDKGGRDFREALNPQSLEALHDAVLEPSLGQAAPGSHFQLERLGYFYADPKDSKEGAPVYNRVVTLKDSWSKISGQD